MTLRLTARTGSEHLLAAALLALMRRASHTTGCSGAKVLANVDDSNEFWYCEDWRDTEALEVMVRGEHLSQLLALMETSEWPPVLEFRTISGVRGLDYVAAVREIYGLDR